MNNEATVKLVLDTKSKDAAKSLKIRVTYNRIPRLYTANTKIKLTKEQFENDKLKITKEAKNAANRAFNVAKDIVEEMGIGFSFDEFVKLYNTRLFGKPRDLSLFKSILEDYIDYKKEIAKRPLSIKTIKSYRSAINWANKYKKDVKIGDVNSSFAIDLITYMKKTNMSESTLHLYLRSLKAIYNHAVAIKKAYLPNPFDEDSSGESTTSTVRQLGALTDEEYDKLLSYRPKTKKEKMGQDFFVLSIQCCGANIGDILLFHNSNIKGGKLSFIRKKTQKHPFQITMTLTPLANALLNKYGRINSDAPNDYILPYLSKCKDENAIENKIHDVIQDINAGLKSVCEAINIRKITTYAARHTYASTAQSEGMTAEQIQKFLGHQSSRTTQIYLKQINSNVIKQNDVVLQGLAGGRYAEDQDFEV